MSQEELYGQQKRSGYPGYNLFSPKVSVPGQLQGETVNEFAQAKQGGVVPSPVSTGSSGVVDKPLQATSGVQTGKVGAGSTPFVVSPNSSTDGMDYLGSLLTTQADEERMRKASLNNRRIMAVSDALRHIGNIYNTANYATPQQFNNPVLEEKARYENERSVRDAANLRYYSYKQAKAAQDAKQRQWEQQLKYNMAKDAANLQALTDYRNATIAEQQRYHDMVNTLNTRKVEDAKENNAKRTAIMQQNADANTTRASRYGTGGSRGGRVAGSSMPNYEVVDTYERDEDGRVKRHQKTRTVKHTDGQISTSTKTTTPKKKTLPGVTSSASNTTKKKRLP